MTILVYELYGHYSFNARDGGEPTKLTLENGYAIEDFYGTKVIVGRTIAFSVEEAIYHGLARVAR